MLQAERALMADTLRTLADQFDGVELSKALDDFGFEDLLVEEPGEAVSALFTEMGRAGSMCTALQAVLRLPLTSVLPDDAMAGLDVTLPGVGSHLVGHGHGGTVAVRGLVIGGRRGRGYAAPVAMDGELVWVRIADTKELSRRVIEGLDPGLGMTEVTGVDLPVDVVLSGEPATTAWAAVATAGRVALGCQIIGAVGQMIDLAVDHARTRVQFGRPIGSFQAVRNRLAEAHVAREGAAAALDLAWFAEDGFLAGLLAKSLAGRAARIAAAQCQQVLAGIGFTAEHPFHRFLARALVLDSVLGSATDLPKAIGAHVMTVGTLPRLVEL
jgi:hypothetical protein